MRALTLAHEVAPSCSQDSRELARRHSCEATARSNVVNSDFTKIAFDGAWNEERSDEEPTQLGKELAHVAQDRTLRWLQDACEAGAFTVEELSARTGRVPTRIARPNDGLAESEANLANSRRTVELRALGGQLRTLAEQGRSGMEHLDGYVGFQGRVRPKVSDLPPVSR